jgi:uncharacterized protein (TIGR02594 family)
MTNELIKQIVQLNTKVLSLSKELEKLEKIALEEVKAGEKINMSPRSLNADLLFFAMTMYGLTETKGNLSTAQIMKMYEVGGHTWVKDDATPWCSAFMNYVAKQCSAEYTGKLNARSWLDVGQEVHESDLKIGDIVILWRIKPSSVYGHVGMLINEDENYYYLLGGNQSDKVQISRYKKYRFLGARRLRRKKD